MNNEKFQSAKVAYGTQDYERALSFYMECLQDAELAPGETGSIYHQVGNCLVKMKKPAEAITAYLKATEDVDYDACGNVNYNLGMAYASLHDFDSAVKHFEIAVSDRGYETPFKAYMGMGNSLMKMGKTAEAGVAFREAALDESNPDPTKALLNLGVCFMALDRPNDAIASYESALQFRMPPATKNKLHANLGQAYVAAGQMQKAVDNFDLAIADKTYFLSDSASVDYQRAIAAVSQGTAELAPLDVEDEAADMSGLDVVAGETAVMEPIGTAETFDPEQYYMDEYQAEDEFVGEPDSERFFTATEAEIEQWSKDVGKKRRRHKNVVLKVIVGIFVVILLLFGGAAFLYTQGFGFPQQEQVAQQLFADPQGSTGVFARDISEATAQNLVSAVPQDANATIDGVNKSMTESTVFVTAHTPEGGTQPYKVTMVRDVIGWKVANVEMYFASQN